MNAHKKKKKYFRFLIDTGESKMLLFLKNQKSIFWALHSNVQMIPKTS